MGEHLTRTLLQAREEDRTPDPSQNQDLLAHTHACPWRPQPITRVLGVLYERRAVPGTR